MPSRIEDYALIGDCESAALVGRDDPPQDAGRLHRALGHEPGSALLALGLVEALARMGEGRLASEGAWAGVCGMCAM